jgi:hypothetical protein
MQNVTKVNYENLSFALVKLPLCPRILLYYILHREGDNIEFINNQHERDLFIAYAADCWKVEYTNNSVIQALQVLKYNALLEQKDKGTMVVAPELIEV